MNDRVVIHLDNEGVADVRLNRADKMNALDSAMIEGILAAQDQLRAEPRLRAVVLHGEGRAFCAGLDISRFTSMGSGENGRLHVGRSHSWHRERATTDCLGLARSPRAGDCCRPWRGIWRRTADRAGRRYPLRDLGRETLGDGDQVGTRAGYGGHCAAARTGAR